MQLVMEELFKKNKNILFSFSEEGYSAIVDDIEIEISYNNKGWNFSWIQTEEYSECKVIDWCENNDCEYTSECSNCIDPIMEQVVASGLTNSEHKFITNPKNLEEVRLNILHEYRQMGYGKSSFKPIPEILYYTWLEE